MASFLDMFKTIRLQVQSNVADDDIRQSINNAQRQLCEAFDWSFQFVTVVFNSVAPRSNGLITASAGSPIVIGSGTTFGVNDIGSFLWIGGQTIAPLPVIDVQPGQILTLFAPWPGPTMQQVGYTLAPLYYPIADALEVREVLQQEYLVKCSRNEINRRDPARVGFGGSPSYEWCPAPDAEDGTQSIELWPTPGDARPYQAEIKRNAPVLVDDTDRPLCPSAVLEAKALVAACLSAYATTGAQQWVGLADRYQQVYLQELEDLLSKNSARLLRRSGVPSTEADNGRRGLDYAALHDRY